MRFEIFLPIIVLMVCFLVRVPIAFSLIGASLSYLLFIGGDVGQIVDVVMGSLYTNNVIIAAPLFIFAANILTSSKVAEYMYLFVKSLFGGKRGATAYMNIGLSLIFAGMSGSCISDACGIGVLEINAMKEDGYDEPFSCALTAATAVVGPIFPPSIQMVIFAMLSGASVGKLFLGGIIPAFLICIFFGLYVWYISRKREYPRGPKYTVKEFLKNTWKALPALITPVILLGGIYGGIVTATESGVIAATYAIIISVFVYKVLGIKGILLAIKDTIIQAGIVMACLASSFALSFVVVQSGLGDIMATAVTGLTDNSVVFVILINIILLLSGMFFPAQIANFVIIPLLLPIAKVFNIDFVYLGVLATINIMIGNITPPFGFLCFAVSGLSGVSLNLIFKEIIPMIIMLILILLLLTFVPQLILFIPNLMQ